MNRKSAWIVFAVALLIALPTRLYQIFFLADQNTGFYTDGGNTTGIISGCLAAGILLMAAMCFLDRRTLKVYRPIRSISAAVLGIMAGLGLVVESLFNLAAAGEQNHFMYMILSLFGILAGAVLILTAYDFATEQNHFARYPLLALIPPLWGCVCLIALFITYVAVVNVSENIYDSFTVIFLLLFLFTQAKMLAGVNDEKSSRLIYVFGLPAILLSFFTGISGAVTLFSGVGQVASFPAGMHLVNILMALYVFAFLLSLRRLPDVEQPDLPEAVQPQDTPAEEPVQPPTLIEWKNCWEFLNKAYQSEEKFIERSASPFYSSKN